MAKATRIKKDKTIVDKLREAIADPYKRNPKELMAEAIQEITYLSGRLPPNYDPGERFRPGHPYEFKQFRPGLMGEAIEVWTPVTFVEWDNDYPVIKFKDGSLLKLSNCGGLR